MPRLSSLLLCVPLVGCAQPTDPVTLVRPELASLSVDVALADAGVLRIDAIPRDSDFSATAAQRIPVRIRSAGDVEDVLLHRGICVREGAGPTRCDEFVLLLADGADFAALERRAESLPGRLIRTRLFDDTGEVQHTSSGFATVVLFDGSLREAMARAAWWPGVTGVDFVHVGYVASVGAQVGRNHITVAIPLVREAGGVPGDGALHVAPDGETVTVVYDGPTDVRSASEEIGAVP